MKKIFVNIMKRNWLIKLKYHYCRTNKYTLGDRNLFTLRKSLIFLHNNINKENQSQNLILLYLRKFLNR